MDIKEFYELTGSDYSDAASRLMNDQLIEKFVLKFITNQNIDLLVKSLEDRNFETAFMEAHTLKGVSLNLSFTKLALASSELTELLRNYKKETINYENALEKLKTLKLEYNALIEAYNSLDK